MASPSEMRGQIALVTGARGFTGRYVVADLRSRGYDVIEWGHSGEGGQGVRGVDLTDRDAVLHAINEDKPDVAVHLAAISFVGHGDIDAIYRVNVVGTRNLLEGMTSLGARRNVLVASSASVYGNVEGAVDELVQPSPQNDYAVSKLAMEYMTRLWQDKLSITIVRPFNYTGVGQSEKFLLPKIVSHFRQRAKVIELGNLDVSRDFYDVRLVAQAYGSLLGLPGGEDVYNICSGQEVTLNEVITMMRRISGHDIEVRVNPAFVRANEVRRLRGDNAKLRAAIGELPRFSLEDTLAWMYSSGAAS